jgi:hypothetical protein
MAWDDNMDTISTRLFVGTYQYPKAFFYLCSDSGFFSITFSTIILREIKG